MENMENMKIIVGFSEPTIPNIIFYSERPIPNIIIIRKFHKFHKFNNYQQFP